MKRKALPFKKGMKVVWLYDYYGWMSLQEAEVSVVTTRDGEPVVYARYKNRWGDYNGRSFSPVAGMFQENPYPIWKLIPLDGKNMKRLYKRVERANKLFREYEQRYREITEEVDSETRDWKYAEINRRTEALENGPKFLQNVISRLGFKRPVNGVKVKVNGVISKVK